VQALAERFTANRYTPASTLRSLASWKNGVFGPKNALPVARVWLHLYGGICPVTRCAKHMLNGPCSGSREDQCEVNPGRPCAWQLIYKRLKDIGQLDRLKEIKPPKTGVQACPAAAAASSATTTGCELIWTMVARTRASHLQHLSLSYGFAPR